MLPNTTHDPAKRDNQAVIHRALRKPNWNLITIPPMSIEHEKDSHEGVGALAI
jgi:hypothetical protein